MLFQRKSQPLDAQIIVQAAQKLINNTKVEVCSFRISKEDAPQIEAAYQIMNCHVNREYYSPIRMVQLGENLLILERIKGEVSPSQLEFECYTYIATYIFSVVNEAPPEIFPLQNIDQILSFIYAHKRKMGKLNFTYLLTKCLNILELTYLARYEQEADIQIIIGTIEAARITLSNKNQYGYEESIRKKCAKYKCVKISSNSTKEENK